MRRLLALLALAALPAAAQQIDDPANLMGERVSAPALADTLPINHGAPALEQLLRKLRTRASMMFIVAHPDDEDGGLLTLESRGMGARVAMLTLTRGEGGQNLMSADFNDALGLIRTQELLAEDRYTGVDQFFGTEVDFGFSKTKEESFAKWTHDRVLYDAVRAVRLYRPLVLASTFIGGVTDGHGQHQVSGEICQEVFLAAADPKVFPEMGLPAWAPLKVYARVPFAPITEKGMFDYATGKFLPPHFHNYVTGVDTMTAPEATVTIHEGEVPNIPAFEGKSYVQFARQGLALQKSQIGSNFRVPPAGRVDVGYTLMATRTSVEEQGFSAADKLRAKDRASDADPVDEDLFTGIDTSLLSLASLAPSAPASLRDTLAAIDNQAAEAQKAYDPRHVELTAEPLLRALKLLDSLIHDSETASLPQVEKFNLLHELRIKRVQFNNAALLARQVTLTAVLGRSIGSNAQDQRQSRLLTTDSYVAVTATESNHSSKNLRRDKIEIHPSKSRRILVEDAHSLPAGYSEVSVMEADIDQSLPASRPYFSRQDLVQPYYDVSNAALRNSPATPPSLTVEEVLEDDGVPLRLSSIVQGLRMHEVDQPASAVPPLSIAVAPRAGILTPSFLAMAVDVQVQSNVRQATGTLSLGSVKGWDTSSADQFSIANAGEQFRGRLVANPPEWSPTPLKALPKAIPAGSVYDLQVTGFSDGRKFTEGYRPVGYPGLTYTNLYTPATFRATAVNVTTAPDLRIAYLPGTGDDVPEFLPSLFITPTILTVKELSADTLKQYDAVVLGVRAYAAHPELAGAGSDPLKAYAQAGGIVIAQYDSGGFNPASAPFPYTLPGDSAHNVVDEDQPVTLLDPQDPLLTWPNRITSADFDHWVAERGHGFASDWAPEYKALLETHDPDQDPQKGGLLLAKVGKGAYIYCAFALYRQLPEGVPGAYRLVANLLSYAKNPSR